MSTERPVGVDEDGLHALAGPLADALSGVPGVVGVVLGGSRARGTHVPTSDLDLGVYYDTTLDLAAMQEVARRVDPRARVSGPGEWGPWVDGGAWLATDAGPVDLILRSVDRVEQQVERATRGAFAFHQQPGHPLGFLDVAYAGELALGQVLADPGGVLDVLRSRVTEYPEPLGDALEGIAWEAEFCCELALKGLEHADLVYVTHLVSRALLIAAHVIMARGRRWVINEKGLVRAAAALPDAPPGFAARAVAVQRALATEHPDEARRAIGACRGLLGDVAAAGHGPARGDGHPIPIGDDTVGD